MITPKMKLDHIVYFSKLSPEEVVAQQIKNGRHAVKGGRHEKWGTSNALLYTRNAYIEWLCIDDIAVAQNTNHPLTTLLLHDLSFGEGWGTICLSVNDIENFDSEINKKGFKTSGAIDGQRKTPDGQLRKWKMLFINQSDFNKLPFPFFIEWSESESDRIAKLRGDGSISSSNDQIAIRECIFEADDPAEKAELWGKLLSVPRKENIIELSDIAFRFVNNKNKSERLRDVIFA